jgi:hypothetical protein
MGTSAIFVAPLIDIGSQFGLAAIFGAVILMSPVEVVIGYFFDDVRGLFPPLVTGIVVMLVGLTLIPIAMQYSAGGPGAETYGNLEHLGLAALVFLVAVGFNQFLGGFMRAASVLVAVVVGYPAAIPLGLLDLSGVADAGWIAVPVPLQYGLAFEPSALLLVGFAYVITAMETIGDISGTTESVGRDPENDEMSGGLVADGVMSAFAAFLGAFPNTSFSQNVGLIGFTGVASRFVVAITGGVIAKPLEGGHMAGNLVALGDGAIYAAMITYMRHEGKTETGNDIAWCMLVAALLLSPAVLVFGPGAVTATIEYPVLGVELPVVLWAVCLGVISTGFAYFGISFVLKTLNANVYALVDIIVSPVVASTLGYLVFAEVPGRGMIIGGVLLLTSGFWLTRGMSRDRERRAVHPCQCA